MSVLPTLFQQKQPKQHNMKDTKLQPLHVETTAIAIRPNDVGFRLTVDIFRKRLKPSFLEASPCLGQAQGPPRPYSLQHISPETWEAFSQETIAILDRQSSVAIPTALTTCVLAFMPPLVIPAFHSHHLQTLFHASIYYLVYLLVLLLLFPCICWIIVTQTHDELEEVRNKYTGKFYNAGIELLCLWDGNAAYWVFRPLGAYPFV
jgi:hypothetical protein